MFQSRMWGGTLLIAGTTIGAAMLALPISSGMAGFGYACLGFLICFLVMLWTALLLLEVTLSFQEEVSLITMTRLTLGPLGEALAVGGLLLLLYALIAAYMVGSGPFFAEFFPVLKPLGFWPILLLFGPFVYLGIRSVDLVNRLLMVGLVVAYGAMVFYLAPKVEISKLLYADSHYGLLSFAVLLTAFGYHPIIPSLSTYLNRDVSAIKKCIVLGSLIPMGVYLIWEVLILGIVPVEGPYGIRFILEHHIPISKALSGLIENQAVVGVTRLFALLAIVTSFLGVAQSLIDLLLDGLKPYTKAPKPVAFVLTFLPPVLFLWIFDQKFITVLEYAGIMVCFLLGILPVCMTWSVRYCKKMPSQYRALGGKGGLLVGFLALCLLMLLAILKALGALEI